MNNKLVNILSNIPFVEIVQNYFDIKWVYDVKSWKELHLDELDLIELSLELENHGVLLTDDLFEIFVNSNPNKLIIVGIRENRLNELGIFY